MHPLILTQINIYPVKSLGGISLKASLTEERGLQYDRRWMLVNEKDVFISQRECSAMVFLGVLKVNDGFEIYLKSEPHNKLLIPFSIAGGEQVKVKIWEDYCDAFHWKKEADLWLSNILNMQCRLVYMPDTSKRNVDRKYADEDEIVSFADGYPYLIIGEETLRDLNNKLKTPVLMNRFRPNFVFSGGQPYDEDNWKDFSMGKAKFSGLKLCGRCIITTIDQETAVKSDEPLRTLSSYRKKNNNVLFGQNLVLRKSGMVKLGDPLIVDSFSSIG